MNNTLFIFKEGVKERERREQKKLRKQQKLREKLKKLESLNKELYEQRQSAQEINKTHENTGEGGNTFSQLYSLCSMVYSLRYVC